MGFLFWLFCSILIVALVLLLFPFSVRIEFEAGERGGQAFFFFFKKKIYEVKKEWGKKKSDEGDSEHHEVDVVAEAPRADVDKKETLKAPDSGKGEIAEQKDTSIPEKNTDVVDDAFDGSAADDSAEPVVRKDEKTSQNNPIGSKPAIENPGNSSEETAGSVVVSCGSAADGVDSGKIEPDGEPLGKTDSKDSDSAESKGSESAESKGSAKKKKRKLTDRETWTILLTPEFDARAFRYMKSILGSVLMLLRIKFRDCYVEGLRMGYMEMGYVAALNGVMKAYPYACDWDLRMDWCHEKELRAVGSVRASITLLRVVCLVLEVLVYAGILAVSYWRRRTRVIKTNELPELGFIRRKIIDFILED